MKYKRVVITGVGVIAPNGIGKNAFWKSIKYGCSGIKPITSFSTRSFTSKLAAQIKNFRAKNFLDSRKIVDFSRGAAFLCSAIRLALDDSKLIVTDKTADEIGICTATTLSNIVSYARFNEEMFKDGSLYVNPALFPSILLNSPSSQASIYFNIRGFNTTISTGFTASLDALKYAVDLIKSDQVKRVIVGGLEEISPWYFAGFYKAGLLSGVRGEELSCPFDRRRNGIVLGEGAAVVVLEGEEQAKKRDADIYAVISGTGCFFDPYKKEVNLKETGPKQSMLKAIKDARLNIKDVDYISASANSTQALDKYETEAIKTIFAKYAKSIPISSIKSMIGETYSASGLFQIIAAIGMMRRGFIAPTINYKVKDKDCNPGCVANKFIEKRIQTAQINSFSLSGNNTSIIISKYT
jgi:3-oxoacyl-[acyl-carrier-protein] synthase II